MVNSDQNKPQTGAPAKNAPDPYRGTAIALVGLFSVTLPALFFTMLALRPAPTLDPLLALANEHNVDPVKFALGRFTFKQNCAVCHGADGQGMPRLGKPLRNSEFVQTHSDDEILEIIMRGREATDPANTSGTPMPARGLIPTTSDERLASVVDFLRTMQDPDEPFTPVDDWVIAAAPGGSGASGVSGVGHDEFITACSACHGASGEGLPGLGKALADSPFVSAKSDAELMTFIKMGRPIWDPDNTTGIDMPPKGGNPALNDEQLRDIVSYIRSLHASDGAQ